MLFLSRWKSLVFIIKKVSFLSRTSLDIELISSPFLTENKEKKSHYSVKAWKNAIFESLKNCCFYSRKRFRFCLENHNLISSPFFYRKQIKKKNIFWSKAWVNPFGKVRFLGLKNFDLIVKKSFFFYLEHY